MAKNSVYSKAKIVREDKDTSIQPYNLNAFSVKSQHLGNSPIQNSNSEYNQVITPSFDTSNESNEMLLNEIRKISSELTTLKSQVNIIATEGVRAKDIDKQVIEAIKDLKQFAYFFEQATFRMEDKLLKTSITIAKKILDIELSQNSTQVAKESIRNIMSKLRGASKITIHLNPKDYIVLQNSMELKPPIKLTEDPNVMPGGVVVASDLGNFDGNIEAKVNSLLENLNML